MRSVVLHRHVSFLVGSGGNLAWLARADKLPSTWSPVLEYFKSTLTLTYEIREALAL